MPDFIGDFLTLRRAENNAANTIRAYRGDLDQLRQFVGGDDWATKLTRTVARGFVAWMNRKQASTARRRLIVLKEFSYWLRSEGILADDICYGITSVRAPRLPFTLPDVPSQEEMMVLLDGPFRTAFPERDRLLLLLLYGDGLRVSEAANLKLSDFRPEQNALLINGKGGMYGKAAKQRLVPLNPTVRAALDQYLVARAACLKTESNVMFFAARNRSRHPGSAALLQARQPITSRSIHRMLLQICALRGLLPMHPHLLRHACATHMLENGCPLDVIANVLGHDNLDITAHYAQVSTRLMMKTYNAAHPHAQQVALQA